MSFRHFHEESAWASEVFICIIQHTIHQTLYFALQAMDSFSTTDMFPHLTQPNSIAFPFVNLLGNFHRSMIILTDLSLMSSPNHIYSFTYDLCSLFLKTVNILHTDWLCSREEVLISYKSSVFSVFIKIQRPVCNVKKWHLFYHFLQTYEIQFIKWDYGSSNYIESTLCCLMRF